MVYKIVAKAAHDTEGAVIGQMTHTGYDIGDIPVLEDIQVKGAAETAMRAGGTASFYLPEPRFQGAEILGERAHGTDAKALAARYAVFGVGYHHLRFDAIVREIEHAPP